MDRKDANTIKETWDGTFLSKHHFLRYCWNLLMTTNIHSLYDCSTLIRWLWCKFRNFSFAFLLCTLYLWFLTPLELGIIVLQMHVKSSLAKSLMIYEQMLIRKPPRRCSAHYFNSIFPNLFWAKIFFILNRLDVSNVEDADDGFDNKVKKVFLNKLGFEILIF